MISKFSGKDIMIISGYLNAKLGGDNTGRKRLKEGMEWESGRTIETDSLTCVPLTT